MTNLFPSKGVNNTYPLSQTFNFDNFPIRLTDRDGQVWFVANDVCAVLEHSNAKVAISRLDDDEKSTVVLETNGGKQETSIISESGLYALVMTSRKPEAKRFKKWVTAEVLPSIRKTGAYSVNEQTVIEDKRTKKQLSDPNYALASEVAAQAAQAVFDVIRRGGSEWFKNPRLLLSMQQSNKYKPVVKPIEPEAFIISLEKLIGLIEKGGGYTSQKQLADLAQACLKQLARYWQYND